MIPVNEPLLDGNEKKYLIECIDTGWIGSDGSFVKRFEKNMADYIGRKYAVALCNATAALELAVRALGIGEGDEVIMPSFTIISCAQAVTNNGAVPIVIDCDLITFNMNVNEIESKITPKTKAIMIVHLYGLPVDVDPILELAKKYNLKIIEDAAEMHGQTYKGKKCGSFGDISIFSFYPNKHITTGEGGMVLCDDEKLSERCFNLRNLCFLPDRRFVHDEIGWNMRMTNMQAALGVAQLERIDNIIAKKRWIGSTYQDLLKDLPNVTLPLKMNDFADNIYWVFALVLNDNYGKDADMVMKELLQKGIGTRPFFFPIHKQPVYTNKGMFKDVSCPNSEKLYEKGFYIPSGLALTKEQINKVSDKLFEVLG